jgi:hypothetical protein
MLALRRITLHLVATAALAASLAAHAAAAPDPKTAEAVVAADDAWGDAETAGNVAFVDALLAPEYRSVGSNGTVTDKATILEHTKSHHGSAEDRAKVDAWRAAHPSHAEVALFGDTAVLTWVATRDGRPVQSCDIFVYRDGHWHAVYSQHSSA